MKLLFLLILGIVQGSEDSWDIFMSNGTCFESQSYSCDTDAEAVFVTLFTHENCTGDEIYSYEFVADTYTCDSMVQVKFACDEDFIYYSECDEDHEDLFMWTNDTCSTDFVVPENIEDCFSSMVLFDLVQFETTDDETIPRCSIQDDAVVWAENGTDTHNSDVDYTICFCQNCTVTSTNYTWYNTTYYSDFNESENVWFTDDEITPFNIDDFNIDTITVDDVSLTLYYDVGYCADDLDDFVGVFDDDYEGCWEECVSVHGDVIVNAELDNQGDCYCHEDCFCMVDAGNGMDTIFENAFLISIGGIPESCADDSSYDDTTTVTDYEISFGLYASDSCDTALYESIFYITVEECVEEDGISQYVQCYEDSITIEVYTSSDCSGPYTEDVFTKGSCLYDLEAESYVSWSWDFDCPSTNVLTSAPSSAPTASPEANTETSETTSATTTADWYTGSWGVCDANTDCDDAEVVATGTKTRDVECQVGGSAVDSSNCLETMPDSTAVCTEECVGTVTVAFDMEISGSCDDFNTNSFAFVTVIAAVLGTDPDYVTINRCTDTVRRRLSSASLEVEILTADADATINIINQDDFVTNLNSELASTGITVSSVSDISIITSCDTNSECVEFEGQYCFDRNYRDNQTFSGQGACSYESDDCCALEDIITQDIADCPNTCEEEEVTAGGGAGAAVGAVFAIIIVGIIGSYFLRKKYYPTKYDHEEPNDDSWTWYMNHIWHGMYVCPFNTYMAIKIGLGFEDEVEKVEVNENNNNNQEENDDIMDIM